MSLGRHGARRPYGERRSGIGIGFGIEVIEARGTGQRLRCSVATLQELADIMGELPEVAEGEHHGHVTWSVRGKGIAWLRPFSKADLKRFGDEAPPAAPILAVNTKDLHEKEGVLEAGINGVFTIQHFANYPAVLVELGVIDRRSLRDLLVDAWLNVAPNELAADFDG